MEFQLTDENDILKISKINTNFNDALFPTEDFSPDKDYFDKMKEDYLSFLRNNGLQTNFNHKKIDG